jgi:hypothetical protein
LPKIATRVGTFGRECHHDAKTLDCFLGGAKKLLQRSLVLVGKCVAGPPGSGLRKR